MAETGYQVEVGSPERDRDRILALWARCGFTSESGNDAARYDWFYLRNPAGAGRVYLLSASGSGELVGAVGAGTRTLSAGPSGQALRASVLVDFVVHPAHRTLYPALKLQRFARDQEYRDAALVYGIPAEKAVPVMVRLGAALRIPSRHYAALICSATYLERLAPRWLAHALGPAVDRLRRWLGPRRSARGATGSRWLEAVPPGIDALWERARAAGECVMGEHSTAFLEWRFGARSPHRWRYLLVTERGSGEPIACIVARVARAELIVGALIMPGPPARWRLGLASLIGAAWDLGVRVVRVDFAGEPQMHAQLLQTGFSVRSERPCFICCAPSFERAALPQRWWLTRADEDV